MFHIASMSACGYILFLLICLKLTKELGQTIAIIWTDIQTHTLCVLQKHQVMLLMKFTHTMLINCDQNITFRIS